MSEKFYSSQLLNYIERVDVGGYAKTAFYTEINTNLKVNDKIFILNGNYDSNDYIENNRYAKYVDGYRILSIDNCRIVLDIDFTGDLPFISDDIDNFIKVWNIQSLRDMQYADTQLVDSYSSRRESKYEKGSSNNIIFSTDVYPTFGINQANSFWAKNLNTWVNINSDFVSNTFGMTAGYPGSYFSGGTLPNNDRLFIYNEDFTYNKLYKQRNIYKYQSGEWVVDTKYKTPILSKLNFRDGKFNGNHFDGVYGTNLKRISWLGTYSNWMSGTLINSEWINGILNSKSTISSQSFYSKIGDTGIPIQSNDFSNNNGFGYNYLLDSNIYSGIINTANLLNCNLFSTSTFSSIDNHYNNIGTYSLVLNNVYCNFCDSSSVELSNSSIFDSKINNSNIISSRIMNSQLFDTVANGDFSSENVIKILSADIWSYIPGFDIGVPSSNILDIRGILKLYISDSDLLRLDTLDVFFITKINKGYIINSLNDDQKIILPYETKYILDRFWNDDFSQQQFTCSAKNKSENLSKILVTATSSGFYNIYKDNDIKYSSIDIDLGSHLGFYYQSGSTIDTLVSNFPTYLDISNVITKQNVNNLFSGTFINNSDINSGILTGSNWISGGLINRQSNIISKYPNGNLVITVNSNDLDVQISGIESFNDNYTSIGRTIWLDSIYNINGYGISGRYKIINSVSGLGYKTITIRTQDSLNLSTLSNDFYVDNENNPNFTSVNGVIIKNSTIISGLFKRSLVSNSLFKNDKFNNFDRSLNPDNIDRLRVLKTIFKNNNNEISNGLFYKSHILGLTWSGGISYNSLWKGPVFEDGLFKGGYWKNGIFNKGLFIESKGITTSIIDFSFSPEYLNWNDGLFNGGQFESSVWLSGTFSNGRLFNSDWYGGSWKNGILGDINIPSIFTTMGYYQNLGTGSTFTNWYDGIVDNAQIGGSSSVYWYDGKLNNGVFTSFGTTQSNESIWYNGTFNGGSFEGLAKWKNGTFNGGLFISGYGWTMSNSTSYLDYSWENGDFNGGQFGNANYATNSTWFNGDFNDGIFKGRVWNNGIFNKGNFIGGSTWSSRTNEIDFVNSFTHSFYGIWRNGSVIDSKLNINSNKKLFTNIRRAREVFNNNVDVNIKNALWLGGTFSSTSAIIDNSIWLDGKFNKGKFKNSSFNPYVDRSNFYNTITSTHSFNLSDSCMWNNGVLDNSNFYISEWGSGHWLNGTMSGGIWKDGVWNYGDANNIYWGGGTWRNGNWDGSPFSPSSFDVVGSYAAGVNYIDPVTCAFVAIPFDLKVGDKIRITQDGLTPPSSYSEFVGVVSAISITILMDVTLTLFSGSPIFGGPESAINKIEILDIISDYQRDIMVRVSQYNATSSVHIIDAFTEPISGPQLLNVDVVNIPPSIVVDQFSIFQTKWNGVTFSIYPEAPVTPDSNIKWFIGSSILPGYINPISAEVQVSERSKYLTVLGTGVTSSIFNDVVGDGGYYDIEVKYNLTTNSNDQKVRIGFFIGANSATSRNLQFRSSGYDTATASQNNFYTFNYRYEPDSALLNAVNGDSDSTWKSMEEYNNIIGKIMQIYVIAKSSNVDYVLVDVYSISVVKYAPTYDPIYNNKLYKVLQSNNPTYSTFAFLPPTITSAVSDTGGVVRTKFGNGNFASGYWENGIWNNGWRDDTTMRRCLFSSKHYSQSNNIVSNYPLNNIDYVKLTNTTWLIYLKCLDSLSIYEVGDKVSVSNIVYIDSNENRSLIKGYSTVYSIDKTNSIIIIKVNVSSNTLRVEADSDNHVVNISKNIWSSGAFLNGRFKGIWNYGLFQGYPYITLMDSSHMIDGIFDGGTFRGSTSSYVLNNTSYIYSSPLVQNFNFDDNNISSPVSYESNYFNSTDKMYTNTTKYLSWIDVNYFTSSKTNIGKETILYDDVLEKETVDINLNGYPTNDIMSSKSLFRDLHTNDSRVYDLGIKYKTYKNFIQNSELPKQFLKPISTTFTVNFSDYGWTYSTNIATPGQSIFSSNLTNINSGVLEVKLPNSTDYVYLENKDSHPFYTNRILEDFLTIENYRYSVVEFEISKFYGNLTYSKVATNGNTVVYPSIYLMNDPRSDSPGNDYHQAINRDIVNHITTPNIIKREYFYNRNSLGLYFSGGFTASFSNISFNEIDMIPFFQYATESHIDNNVKSPFRATAPFIDYKDNQFNFIGNITLTIDSAGNYNTPISNIITNI